MRSKGIIALLATCLSLLLIGFGGCSRVALDTSLRTGKPCSAPCWNDLIPGESTEADVRRILQDSPWVKTGSVQTTPTEKGGVDILIFGWEARRHPKRGNTATIRDGRLLITHIAPDFDLPFREVVERFGPPEGVYADATIGRGTFTARLDYPSQGLRFEHLSFTGQNRKINVAERTGFISPDYPVTDVYYYHPTSMESALRDVFLVQPGHVDPLLRDEHPWQGFGMVGLARH